MKKKQTPHTTQIFKLPTWSSIFTTTSISFPSSLHSKLSKRAPLVQDFCTSSHQLPSPSSNISDHCLFFLSSNIPPCTCGDTPAQPMHCWCKQFAGWLKTLECACKPWHSACCAVEGGIQSQHYLRLTYSGSRLPQYATYNPSIVLVNTRTENCRKV